jgi:hypothetical protein
VGYYRGPVCSRTLIWISVVLSYLWWALVCLTKPFCTPCAEMVLVPEPCSILPIRFVVSGGETRQFTCNVLNATAHWISIFSQRLSERSTNPCVRCVQQYLYPLSSKRGDNTILKRTWCRNITGCGTGMRWQSLRYQAQS